VRVGGLPWMRGVFYGVSAAVIAIIGRSVAKLGRATLGRDRLLWAIAAASAVVTVVTASEIVLVFVAGGLLVLAIRRRRAAVLPSLAWAPVTFLEQLAAVASGPVLWEIFVFFGEASLFVFGSGLAVVPFLHAGVVEGRGWLSEQQFLDAVAVAMITPGPVVITVAFIGFLVAGLAGAGAAGFGMFLPTYVVTVLAAPYYERLRSNEAIRAFVDGITAATTGGIAGAAVILGRNAIVDLPTALLACLTLLLLLRTRISEPLLIVVAGIAGFLIRPAI
jgi:chromate transporter